MFRFFVKKLIALDVEHSAIGSDVHLVRAAIGAALELEEAGGATLLEVGLLQDKARDLGLGGGEDICRDLVFRDVVVEVIFPRRVFLRFRSIPKSPWFLRLSSSLSRLW